MYFVAFVLVWLTGLGLIIQIDGDKYPAPFIGLLVVLIISAVGMMVWAHEKTERNQWR
jgi:hypothetical protein